MTLSKAFCMGMKKLGLGEALFRIVSAKHRFIDVGDGPAGEALNRLLRLSPMPSGSCIRESEPEYKIDFDVHIIVPCYNCQDYIIDCLRSVSLKHSCFVSAIDDGSADKSPELIKKFSKKDDFETIFKDNGGSSSARNAGLSKIRGKYLFFLDADDMINPNVVDEMLDFAFENDCDLVQGDFERIDRHGHSIGRTFFKHGYINAEKDASGFTCGKLIRSSLFKYVRFPEGFLFEDSIMCHLVYPLASKSFGYDGCSYFYRKNLSGATHSSRGNIKSLDDLYVLLRIEDDRDKLGYKPTQAHYDRMLSQCFLHYSRIIGLGKEVLEDVFVVYANLLNKKYRDFKTDDRLLEPMERSIRAGDFALFCSAAKYL